MDQTNSPDSCDTNESDQTQPMLDALEARILGALMEKQLTTPDAYPLTLNSLVLACNQKTSREPVTNLQEGETQQCLYKLQDRKLVEFDYGARANKFYQRLSRTLHLGDPEHAIFCVMLLRGSQTINELFSRTKRMYEFKQTTELESLLQKLLSAYTPLIKIMPSHSGQREVRYMHLLCGEPGLAEKSVATAELLEAPSDDLITRVDELEKQVMWLMEKLKGQ